MDYLDILNLITIVVALLTGFLVLAKNPRSKLYRLIVYYLISVAFWAFIDFQSNIAATGEEFCWWRRFDIFWYFNVLFQVHLTLEYTRNRFYHSHPWVMRVLYMAGVAFAVRHIILFIPDHAEKFNNLRYIARYTAEINIQYTFHRIIFMGMAFYFSLYLIWKYFVSRDKLKSKTGLMAIAFSFPILIAIFLEGYLNIFKSALGPFQITNSLLVSSVFITILVFRYQVLDQGSELALPVLVQSLTDGVILTDETGVITYHNRAAERITGLSDKELWIRPVFRILEGINNGDSILELIENRKDVSDFECQVITREERPPVSISVTFIREKDWVKGMVFVVREMSERIRIEKELRRLRTAIDQSPATIVITDTEGNIEYVNPGFSRITGYTLAEAIGQNPRVLKSGLMPEYTYRDLWAVISSGKTWVGEFINKKKSGEFYWESATITPVKDEDGKILSYIAIKEDISQRKKAEEALLRSEQEMRMINAQKDRFLSIIAHDLRAPFNILVNASEIVFQKFHELEEKDILMLLESIHTSASNTHGLLENLLLWSRSQLGRIELNLTLFDISKVVKEVADTLSGVARNKNIALVNEVQQHIYVYADRNMIMMIIRNLVSNALKFTPRDGTITIGDNKQGNGEVGAKMVEFFVKDTGVGMEPDKVVNLFRIDQNVSTEGTENEPGTGLGLILCREFIEKNGGSIRVISQPGAGSTFFFTLRKGTR
jgi:PAS domain S-box-containing protein